MMRNFLTLYRLDLGVETSHLLTMSLSLPERKYPAIEQRLAFYQRLAGPAAREPAVPGGERREQRADAGRLRAAARRRWASARLRRAAADGDDAHRRSAVLRDHRPDASARTRVHGHRRLARPGERHHQHAVRADALPERGSDRPPHHVEHRPRRRPAPQRRHPHLAHGHHRRDRPERAAAGFCGSANPIRWRTCPTGPIREDS